MRFRPILLFLTICAVSVVFVACSSGPSKPQPGTPGFFFLGAKETFTAGDYLKTCENLDKAARGAEYEAKALTWNLVLNAGVIGGYIDLADAFDKGAREAKANPTPFRKNVANFRRAARPLTLQFAERFQHFQKLEKTPEIELASPFPPGSQAEPPLLAQVKEGNTITAIQVDDLQTKMIARAVILATADATGSGDDSSKALQMFQAGPVKIPRATFMMAMARALSNTSELYAKKHLDEADRMRIFCQLALDALKDVPDSLEVKALTAKLQKTLKDLPPAT